MIGFFCFSLGVRQLCLNTLAFNNILTQMFIRFRKFIGALGHQLLKMPAVLLQFGFYLFFLHHCPPLAQHTLNDSGQQLQILAVHILDQIVLRAAPHGLDGDRGAVCTGQHQNRYRYITRIATQLGQKFKTIQIRQVIVE